MYTPTFHKIYWYIRCERIHMAFAMSDDGTHTNTYRLIIIPTRDKKSLSLHNYICIIMIIIIIMQMINIIIILCALDAFVYIFDLHFMYTKHIFSAAYRLLYMICLYVCIWFNVYARGRRTTADRHYEIYIFVYICVCTFEFDHVNAMHHTILHLY